MLKKIEVKYYKELEKFKVLSKELISNGGTYFVIIANHELLRHLYPFEPYLDKANINNPLENSLNLILKLNNFLKISHETLDFYKFDINSFSLHSNQRTLEKETSDIYTTLWDQFDSETMLIESKKLIENRIPKDIINKYIKDKIVLDMGCGSGRFSIALALLGAKKVIAVDLFAQSYKYAKQIAIEKNLNIEFIETSFHNLPFEHEIFDFVFSNGTLHHSTSIQKSLKELYRVLKKDHKAFLYLYADKGIFWNTRKEMRNIFTEIPIEYTNLVLQTMGLPKNRFFFADLWHVPIESHTTTNKLLELFKSCKLKHNKVISKNKFDLDNALLNDKEEFKIMWGDGEHRYILTKECVDEN